MDREKSFKYTLENIRDAINRRDYEMFSVHVDHEKFFNEGYDEVIDELAKNCAEFHELYPNDLMFKFGEKALRVYNSQFRSVHLGFLNCVTKAYFDKNLTAPKSFATGPIDFCACELRKFLSTLTSDIKKVSVREDCAVAYVEISGDDSFYGKVFGNLYFAFEFVEDEDGMWKLKKVDNARDLVAPFLEMAEKFWPADWDLGIKF